MADLLASPRFKEVLFFVVVIALCADFVFHYGLYRINSPNVDFPSFYYGAKAAFQMHKLPYSPAVWKVLQQSYSEARLFPYIYPPPSLLFFYPASLLDYQTAKLLMLALNNLLVLVFLFFFLFKVMKLKPSSYLALALAVYLFWFFPVVSTIKTGQINLVILMMICLAWFAMKERLGPLWVAIPLAIGITLKLYPILFIPILLFRREYKAIAVLALALLLISLVATWVLPTGIWGDWYEHVASNGYASTVSGLTVASTGNQSINGFLTRLFLGAHRGNLEALFPAPDWVTNVVPFVASGLVLLISLAVTGLGSRSHSEDVLDLQFSLWSLTLFLVAPLSWDHLLVLILPCLYVAARRVVLRREIPQALFVAVVAGLLAWQYPYDDPSFRHGLATLLISVKFFAVLSLWVYYVLLNLRGWRERESLMSVQTPVSNAG
ncbi:MAG TPA: glycosyltransferase family 87 protein [Anaerolineales bacterium]